MLHFAAVDFKTVPVSYFIADQDLTVNDDSISLDLANHAGTMTGKIAREEYIG